MTDLQSRRATSTPLASANASRSITTLRDWLDHLAVLDRLTVMRLDTLLRFELDAIAKCLDGLKATLFPRLGAHAMPMISGLVSEQQQIAGVMGVEPRDAEIPAHIRHGLAVQQTGQKAKALYHHRTR